MQPISEPSTEAKILVAARRAFLQQGFSGARMAAIAQAAGVNKALLHYYYRSKEALYERVHSAAQLRMDQVLAVLNEEETTLVEKIEHFVVEAWRLAQEAPEILLFLTAEAAERPQPVTLFTVVTYKESVFIKQLQEGKRLGLLRFSTPTAVLLQLLSLCLYPLQASTWLQLVLQTNPEEYHNRLSEYYQHLSLLLIQGLKA